jgi:hypothetical protein
VQQARMQQMWRHRLQKARSWQRQNCHPTRKVTAR